MEGLNTLLNQVLRTKNDSYIGANGLEKCYKSLEKLSKSDNAALKVFLYFFPPNSSSEKNIDSFWFIKYEKEENYNEYKFAKDLLNIYIQYMKEKNYKSFESQILEKVKLFKNSKLIGDFLFVLEEFDEKLLAIISYITKDCAYFKQRFELTMSSENIQTFLFINEARHYLSHRKLALELQRGLKVISIYSDEVKQLKVFNEKLKNEIIDLKDENSDLKKNNTRIMNMALDLKNTASYWEKVNANLENTLIGLKNDNINKERDNTRLQNTINGQNNRINDLNNRINDLNNKINYLNNKVGVLEESNKKIEEEISGMKERLENFDLRDKVRMFLRYLYKLLLSKFPNEVKLVTKLWEQIEEIKKLLSKPEFNDFNFITEFINTIIFDKLAYFNYIERDSTKSKRNFKSIKKYMRVNENYDIEKISSFFENLPNINKFINLNLLFYRDQAKVDEEFQKDLTYLEIYKAVFNMELEEKKEEKKMIEIYSNLN